MKTYMRKHQTLEPVDAAIADRSSLHFVEDNHGTSGPVHTSFNDTPITPLELAVVRGLNETAGVSKTPVDPWSGDHVGFFSTLGSVIRTGPNKGRRSYAARGYYEPNAHRSNLTVLCDAYVNQVVLDGDKATGVNFSHSGSEYEVKTKREVLVCQGTIMSPPLLELSGIGNPDILKKAGVQPKINLPSVGENFQEHTGSLIVFQLAPGKTTADSLQDPQVMASAQKALVENRGGPLTAINAIQGFYPYKKLVSSEELQKTVQSIRDTPIKSEFHRKQLDQVITNLESDTSGSIQFVWMPIGFNKENGFENHSRLFQPPPPGEPLEAGLLAVVSYPVSRGSIHISSSGEYLRCEKSPKLKLMELFRSSTTASNRSRMDFTPR
jgi:choline dehydrogenase-like flavoprotein